MPTVLDYYEYAKLATAAYVNLDGMARGGLEISLLSNGQNRLPLALARKTFDPNENPDPVWVIPSPEAYRGNDATGFAATLFEKGGQKVLAIRGTEGLNYLDLLVADLAQIGLLGVALSQAVSMVNYVLRLRTQSDQYVAQLQVHTSLTNPGPEVQSVRLNGILPLTSVYVYFTSPTAVQGIGLIGANETIKVTGHSLGGHLAALAARLFPGLIDEAYIYNAAGFDPISSSLLNAFPIAQALLAQHLIATMGFGASNIAPSQRATDRFVALFAPYIQSALGRGPAVSFGGLPIRNLESEDVAPGNDESIVASFLTGQQVYGEETLVATEANSHLIEPLMDALSMHALIASMNPDLMIGDINKIIEAASRRAVDSEESLLKSLYKVLTGKSREPRDLPTIDNSYPPGLGKGTLADRNLYHSYLLELETTLKADASLRLSSLIGDDVESVLASAGISEGTAHRYALKELNPFVITGTDSIYTLHNANGDLNLFASRTETPAGMTPKYIDDRAAFLYWKTLANVADISTQNDSSASENWRYVDADQRYAVTVFGAGTIPGAARHYAAFGGDRSDALLGDVLADRLYGGQSTDLLRGGAGDDYLEGGAGQDVYQYTASKSLTGELVNDGADDILDTDGKGLVRYTFTEKNLLSANTVRSGVIAGIGIKTGASEWQSPDGHFVYTQQFAGLKASVNGDAGGSVFVLDFDYGKAQDEGFLGIRLIDDATEPIAPIRTYYGDKADWDADGNPANDTQTQLDEFGNTVRADGRDGRLDTPQADRADVFNGSAADEVERFETAGGDDVVKADGSNSLTSTFGGRDIVLTGAGRDVVEAGAGDDWIEGGADDDLLGGGYGDDVIWADAGRINGVQITLAQAIMAGNAGSEMPDQGDLLSGGDGADRLIGAATADLLAGGLDADLIIGGAGNDDIYGDAVVVGAAFGWTSARVESVEDGVKIYRLEPSDYTLVGAGPANPGSADVIYGGAGADWIFAGAGDDYVEGGDTPNDESFPDDVIFGEAGDDILIGGSGSDTLHGDSASVDAAGLSGDDYLDGGLGIDFLFGGGGDDILFGGDDGDVIQGNDGDDILIGEWGNDLLIGGAGKDSYVYNIGDGTDRVQDPDITKDSEYLSSVVFGPGITYDWDIKFRLGSLMIDLGGGDAIHFEGFDPNDPYSTPVLDVIQFADGTWLTFDDILARGFDLDGSDEDDYIEGTAVTDRINAGAGDDIVIGKAGDDVIRGGDGGDDIESGEGDDVVDAGAGADVLKGGPGADTLTGGDGDDLLIGGAGDDVLAGGAGVDSYVLVGGIGVDRITDGEGGEANVLDLAGLPFDAVAIGHEGDDLRVGLRGLDDAVVIADYYTRPQSWVVRGAERDIALEALVVAPPPDRTDAIRTLWDDLKYSGLATTLGQAYAIGWTALGGGRFEGFLEAAWLDYTEQTTTTIYRRAESPFDVLGQTTEETGGWIQVAGFGSRDSASFRYPTFTFLSGRQESDAALVSGDAATAPGQEVSNGQALLTVRDRPPTLNETHTVTSEVGGLVSYDTGAGNLLASVTYEYDLAQWNRNAIAVDVAEASASWPQPLNTVTGNRVLVNQETLDTQRLAVNEIIGGASSNTIVVPSIDPLSNLSFATLVDGGGGDDTIVGGALAYGNAGDDDITTDGILIGGDGDDFLKGEAGARFFFTPYEIGIDRVEAAAVSGHAYLDGYYGALGVTDWEVQAAHAGEYHLDLYEGDGFYFATLEEAEVRRTDFGYGEITFVEPLSSIAPSPTRNDTTALDALVTAGFLGREVVEFADGLTLDALSLTVNVGGASADAHPTQPWHDGGTLSVRWNESKAGFDLEIPDVDYGLVGADLFAQIGEDGNGEPLYAWQTYRLGEGIESFRFADGSEYSLEEMLAQATVVPEYGEFYFLRGSGSQVISRFSSAIVFEPGISSGELEITRDGLDLLLTLSDGSAQGRLTDWYADPRLRPGLELRFDNGLVIDEEELTWQGLFVVGTEGDDVLIGIDGFGDSLDADLGDDVVDGGSGDDDAFGGEGNDIVRGGPGEDDVEVWGEGNNFLDAGPGDDYVYTEGHALVIGGEGDDWMDFYGDAGIAAFNPGDGNDTVYVAGTLTLSLGGGVGPDDLELSLVEADEPGVDDLLLSLGEDDSIRLTRQWEDDPAAWPEITLQLFGSVHRFDFNAIVGALLNQSGGEPGFALRLGDLLETARIGFSETEGVGGALAWQYAATGSTAMVSDDAIRALLAEPAFGVAPQPIRLEQANQPPEIIHGIADQSTLEDAPFEFSIADAFADPDAGDSLSYGAVLADGAALPGWLDFETAGGTFIGTPSNDDVGALQIIVSAADNEGESAESTFVLEVLNVNDAPVLLEPILPQSGRVGEALAFSIDGGFADIDAGDSLAYGVTLADGSALPDWLVFDADAASFAGTPGAGDAGSYTIRVTATDRAGESADAEIALAVAAAPSDDPGGHCGTPGGWPHGHDRDHHPGHGKGHDEHHEEHARHEHGKGRGSDRSHDGSHAWQKKSPKFDFDALLDDFERGERYEPRSQADIRHGWQQVARYSAHLGAGDDDAAHGLLWRGAKDLGRLASGGGQGFGFGGSTGAARGAGEFKCFEGLREGFRRL